MKEKGWDMYSDGFGGGVSWVSDLKLIMVVLYA